VGFSHLKSLYVENLLYLELSLRALSTQLIVIHCIVMWNFKWSTPRTVRCIYSTRGGVKPYDVPQRGFWYMCGG